MVRVPSSTQSLLLLLPLASGFATATAQAEPGAVELHFGEPQAADTPSRDAADRALRRFDLQTWRDEALRDAQRKIEAIRRDTRDRGRVRRSVTDERRALDPKFNIDPRAVERDLQAIAGDSAELRRYVQRALCRIEFERLQPQVQRKIETLPAPRHPILRPHDAYRTGFRGREVRGRGFHR